MEPSGRGVRVLLAEDDAEVRSYLEMALRCQGYLVDTASDGDEAVEMLREAPHYSAILLDIVMPRRDGFEVLKEIRSSDPITPVIMISGASSPLNVVEAMKSGATDFIGKPVTHADLQKALRVALDSKNGTQAAQEETPQPSSSIVFGQSRRMAEIRGILPQVAWSEAPVLVLGETGVGKEILARELHAHSPRAKKPFLKLNCAALPSELVESELFGYDRGAFTGAYQKKPGMFELADGGTLFLDEIGDMDFKLQAKLLQVLQDSEFQRLGGKDTVRVNVRVIAATHKDLDKAIVERTFREDLYYRLAVITLFIPPLRDRKEDIPEFLDFLLKKHANGRPGPAITPALKSLLVAYDWPGNIRELENVVRKILLLPDPDFVVRDLRARALSNQAVEPIRVTAEKEPVNGARKTILEQVSEAKNQAETTAIIAALDSTHWNRKKAAVLLKIDYKALLYKMKKLGIEDRMAMLPAVENFDAASAASPGGHTD